MKIVLHFCVYVQVCVCMVCIIFIWNQIYKQQLYKFYIVWYFNLFKINF